jgi:hypothetical protein
MGVRKLFPRVFAKMFSLSRKGMGDMGKNRNFPIWVRSPLPISPVGTVYMYKVYATSVLMGWTKAPMLVEELGIGMRILKEPDIHGDETSASLNRSDVTTKAPRYNSAS